MAANPTQKQNWFHANQLTASIGEAGKYHSATIVTAGQTKSFSGSGAFMLGASANIATTKIFVDGGGEIVGTEFAVQKIYDIGVSKVTVVAGKVYVFKRQQ